VVAALEPEAGRRATARSNIVPLFDVVNRNGAPLRANLSPFKPLGWLCLLAGHPEPSLARNLVGILTFGASIGVATPDSITPRGDCSNYFTDEPTIAEARKYVAKEHAAGRLAPSIDPNLFIAPLGMVPKPDGTLRRIHDLSWPPGASVNDAIPRDYGSLTYTTVDRVIEHVLSLGTGCIIMKRDIEHAFRNIPVDAASSRYLGFRIGKTDYQELCLPFGLRTAPLIFNLFAEALHWTLDRQMSLQELCVCLEHYLDDFMFICSDRQTADYAAAAYIWVTDRLGVPRKTAKDEIGTAVVILGFLLDTERLELRLSDEKRDLLVAAIHDYLSTDRPRLRDTKSLAGRLSWASHVVRMGRIYTRSIWEHLAGNGNSKISRFKRRRTPQAVRQDLLWWLQALELTNGVYFFDPLQRRTYHLFTDASGIKALAGFFFESPDHNAYWPNHARSLPIDQAFIVEPADRTATINPKEMEAVAVAFTRWSHLWRHQRVIIHCDNTTTVAGLAKEAVRGASNAHLRTIVTQSAGHDIAIACQWLKSEDNGLADALSRAQFERVTSLCPQWGLSLSIEQFR
jgi:hypothetical protein